MNRSFLIGGAILALAIPATSAFAKPADHHQSGSHQDQGSAGSQTRDSSKGSYPDGDPHAHGPYYGALVPPPRSSFGKEYPVCTKEVQDGCINRNNLPGKGQSASGDTGNGELGKGEAESGD
jgi:hypothetical protein